MCTMGALSQGQHRILLKTLDFAEPGIYAGLFRHSKGQQRVIGLGMWAQSGINAGMNESGVGVMMSYFGTSAGNESAYTGRWNDQRAIYNAEALFSARTTLEALECLDWRVSQSGSAVGGTHLIMDASGDVAVLEHEGGRTVRAMYRAGNGIRLAYANTASHGFQEAQERLPERIQRDRALRREVMCQALDAIAESDDADEARQRSKSVLCHHGVAEDGLGWICTHHLDLPGSRANLSGPMRTISGIVLDMGQQSIYYSDGNPCEGEWHELCL